MHSLWLDYMRSVVGNSGAKRGAGGARREVTSSGTIETLGDEQLQMRVSRADLHGAFVKVVRAPNNKLIGLEGTTIIKRYKLRY